MNLAGHRDQRLSENYFEPWIKRKASLPLYLFLFSDFKLCDSCLHPFCLLADESPVFSNHVQHANKVVSDITGLVDFAVRLVNYVLNVPERQAKFWGEFNIQKNCSQSCTSKKFLGLVEMTFGQVHASYSLPL